MLSEAVQYEHHYEMLATLGKVLNRTVYHGCLIEQKVDGYYVCGVCYVSLQGAKAAIDRNIQTIGNSIYRPV